MSDDIDVDVGVLKNRVDNIERTLSHDVGEIKGDVKQVVDLVRIVAVHTEQIRNIDLRTTTLCNDLSKHVESKIHERGYWLAWVAMFLGVIITITSIYKAVAG